MGCGSIVSSGVVVEVAYCGGCGWSIPAKRVCDAIRKRIPNVVIDCRPQNEFTGELVVSLISSKRARKLVTRGKKEEILADYNKIAQITKEMYDQQ